jgi:uncharacterized protein (DUF433 family)
MIEHDLISVTPEILRVTPVFKGTRVQIQSLFDHLESGVNLDEFLEDFPFVSREQAAKALALAENFLSASLNQVSQKPAA